MIFLQIIKRELKIATRKQAEILNPLWFFLIVITLFPLVIGPDPKLLSRIAPGVAWVAALLSALLSFERLFRDDFIDGSLESIDAYGSTFSANGTRKSRCTLVINWFTFDFTFSYCRFIALIRSEYLVGRWCLHS